MTSKNYFTKSIEDTQKIAKEIASSLKGGEVLLLYGDLGSGKTTFIQGLAAKLGIERKIISPTFIIMRSYNLPEKFGNATNFYHLDLYRMVSEQDAKEIGVFDLIGKKENIVAIEWPEKLGVATPNKSYSISLKYIDQDAREIVFKNNYV